jgi:hypothetical protein
MPRAQGKFHTCLLVNAESDNYMHRDTFVGYYAMEYVRQKHRGVWEIQKATELGCRAAARTIQQKGAQTSIPWADEIEQ